MNETIIKQFAKKRVKDFTGEFYNFVFILLNNLIDININKNLKIVLINYLMFERNIVFFNNNDDELQIGRISRIITRDENLLPIDIKVVTLDGTPYELLYENYVMMYNPIAIDYLKMKIEEISSIEKITDFVRQYYKIPVIFQSKDTKVLNSIKKFIKNIFSLEELVTVVNDGFDVKNKLEVIDLKINYITDKLLDENESLKEDILEILGIYKNTSGNRERVNESELIISNSLTTVNKLGIEDTLTNTIKEVNEKFKTDFKVNLNINKIFGIMNQEKKNDEGVK